jgi:glycosyltransferase involved in cell wall biosynthesis
MEEHDLTTVVIPAHNAADTLDQTLDSVRAQTHRALEIIIVDDGSTDATAQIARRHVQADARVRLLQQPNAGVAAARNAAIAAGRGEFIAPIDADDLWQPQKIEKQIAAMHVGGPRIGLVYTWFAFVDADGRVTGRSVDLLESGDVLRRLCSGNFVGNGSTPLMRASVVRRAGGYDETLHQRVAQGCEDFRLYLEIAQQFHFAVVPEYLTGYRQLPSAMSNDVLQMFRSSNLVADEMLELRPELRRQILEGKANAMLGAYFRARSTGLEAEARAFRRELVRSMPYRAFLALVFTPLRNKVLWRLGHRPALRGDWFGRPFLRDEG